MTAKACRASGDTRLERVAAAADQLYPKDVEQKLEELFEYKDKDGSGKKTESIFVERKFYPKGYPRYPVVTVQEAHAKTIEEDPDELKRERDERQRAWEEPKEHKMPTPAPKRVQKENASPSPEENP